MSGEVPTYIRGVHYPSMSEAARQIGCSLRAVQHAINSGNPDSAGLGRNHKRKRPVIVDGVEYESVESAARAIGGDPTGIRWALDRNNDKYKSHKLELPK